MKKRKQERGKSENKEGNENAEGRSRGIKRGKGRQRSGQITRILKIKISENAVRKADI